MAGKVFMDFQDDKDAYSGGRVGLRQVYDSDGEYANVKLWETK